MRSAGEDAREEAGAARPGLRIGGHLGISRGLAALARQAVAWGCEAVQLFSRSPRGGPAKAWDPADLEQMRAALDAAGIGPLIVHCPYYVSPAHDRPEMGDLAVQIIAEDLARARAVGASFVVVHAGHSRTGGPEAAAAAVADRVAAAIRRYREQDWPGPGEPLVLIENGAGGRGDAAGTMAGWAACIHGVSARGLPVGACLDTAHLWGAGWELGEQPAQRLLSGISSLGILDMLKVIHFNDSSAAPGSRRDRHEHIGEGLIPEEVFSGLLRSPQLGGRAGIVETDPADGGVSRDVLALKRLRDGWPGAPAGPAAAERRS